MTKNCVALENKARLPSTVINMVYDDEGKFISMAVANTNILCYFFRIIYLMGTVDSAQHNYRNIWAVKVNGSLQDAKQLSFKHGFVYDKHVSTSFFKFG